MEPELKVGLAGLGSVSRTILHNIQTIPNVKLTAVADIRQEPLDRAREQYGVDTYTSVEAMCESSNVDAIWVCTPNLFHTEHTIIAAEHGKQTVSAVQEHGWSSADACLQALLAARDALGLEYVAWIEDRRDGAII